MPFVAHVVEPHEVIPASTKPPWPGTISGPPESPLHVSLTPPPAQTIVAGSKLLDQIVRAGRVVDDRHLRLAQLLLQRAGAVLAPADDRRARARGPQPLSAGVTIGRGVCGGATGLEMCSSIASLRGGLPANALVALDDVDRVAVGGGRLIDVGLAERDRVLRRGSVDVRQWPAVRNQRPLTSVPPHNEPLAFRYPCAGQARVASVPLTIRGDGCAGVCAAGGGHGRQRRGEHGEDERRVKAREMRSVVR